MIGLSMTAFRGKWPGDFEEWLSGVEGLGFEFVELVSEWPHYLTPETKALFEDALGSHNLKLTVHAPFSDLNIASFNESIRSASLGILRETLSLASELGAMVVTIHPGHCSPLSRRYSEEYLTIHRRSFETIAEWSEEFGVKVGVENMPSFPILDAQTCLRLAELLDGIDLGVTFDVGHLNTTTRDFRGFLRTFGDRIVHLHLHDNHGDRDEHLPPGDGTVPWGELLPLLPEAPIALEVTDLPSAGRGLAFLRRSMKL